MKERKTEMTLHWAREQNQEIVSPYQAWICGSIKNEEANKQTKRWKQTMKLQFQVGVQMWRTTQQPTTHPLVFWFHTRNLLPFLRIK